MKYRDKITGEVLHCEQWQPGNDVPGVKVDEEHQGQASITLCTGEVQAVRPWEWIVPDKDGYCAYEAEDFADRFELVEPPNEFPPPTPAPGPQCATDDPPQEADREPTEEEAARDTAGDPAEAAEPENSVASEPTVQPEQDSQGQDQRQDPVDEALGDHDPVEADPEAV